MMRMLSSWVLILFVAAKPKRRSVARKLVPLVAGAFWPLALPIGEEAPARAWWSVQLPQQYRVAVRHEPVLLLQLAVAVVVVACVVEPRHVQAAVGKSLMENRQVGSFISYLGSAGRANFVQSLGGLLSEAPVIERAPVSGNHLTHFPVWPQCRIFWVLESQGTKIIFGFYSVVPLLVKTYISHVTCPEQKKDH